MARDLGLALQILEILAEEQDWLTRGEIRRRLGVPPDCEVTARIRELRDYEGYGDFIVLMKLIGDDYRYRLHAGQRQRAKRFLASWKARKVAA